MKEENKRILSRVTTPFHLLSLSYRLGFGPRRVIAISWLWWMREILCSTWRMAKHNTDGKNDGKQCYYDGFDVFSRWFWIKVAFDFSAYQAEKRMRVISSPRAGTRAVSSLGKVHLGYPCSQTCSWRSSLFLFLFLSPSATADQLILDMKRIKGQSILEEEEEEEEEEEGDASSLGGWRHVKKRR